MNEKLLHFVWKFGLFHKQDLFTTTGEKLEIVHPGVYNSNAGADFQNSKIRIGKTLWAGNTEIHVHSKDWFAHRHEQDAAYNNVVLHVVYESGGKIAVRKNGENIPTIELKDRINPVTLLRYQELSKQKTWIPCAKFFNETDAFTFRKFQERLLVERLENKIAQIELLLNESGNDWENVMFQILVRYLGAGINKEPFFLLAKSLPVKVWAKHQNDLLQMEALLFGQAGFLEEKFDDDYPNQLRKEYLYLKRLHNLEPLHKSVWKFLRLRPSHFPTVRLAQLAALMNKETKLFSAFTQVRNIKSLQQLLDVEVSPYWKNHYRFDKSSPKAQTNPGAAMKNILLINAVVPVLFAYGKYKDADAYCERAISLLEKCNPENNSVITGWKKLNVEISNAGQTQALLQLKGDYCDKFRCLDCAIGVRVLK